MRVNHYLYRGGIMETGMKMIMDIVTNLTKIFVAFIGFGVVAGIVFGGNAFLVGDVLENLLGVVSMLGDAGIVGLLVAAILIGLLK
tara:strand:- start:229 stop:486 length:258 start_codon:yes stop_codon:yes gene_type:complete